MSITKRPNSVNWYSEFVINGKKYVKSTKTNNRALASKIDQQYYKEALEQSKLGGQSITLRKAFELFAKSKQENPRYHTQLLGVFKWINEHMDTDQPMSKINNRFLHDFVELRTSTGSKLSTVKHNLGLLMGTIKLCRKLGYDVCQVEAPSVKVKNTKTRVLSKAEEERLLLELQNTNRPGLGGIKADHLKDLHDMTVILLSTGCRWCEIAEMKWEQIDFDNRLFHIWRKKTSTASVLPMSDRAYDVLKTRLQKSEWLFPNAKLDGPKKYSSEPFKNACKRAGIEGVTFHTTRHSTITRLTQAGLSLAQVQAISGHTNLQSLQRYQHLTSLDVVDKVRSILNN